MYQFLRNLYRYGLEYYSKYYACYRGVVISNQDPLVLGRLQVSVPAIHGDDHPDYWAPSKGMAVGNQMTFWALPQKGDLIWVTFENGDVRYPIWEYGHFINSSQVPEPAQKPNNYFFQTPKGQRLEFDDEAQSITLVNPAGNQIILSQDGRVTVSNNNENLKTLLRDMMNEIVKLQVITPAGDGIVGPVSLQAFIQLQQRLILFLK